MKYTPEMIERIKKEYNTGKNKQLAEEFGVSPKNLSMKVTNLRKQGEM